MRIDNDFHIDVRAYIGHLALAKVSEASAGNILLNHYFDMIRAFRPEQRENHIVWLLPV